MKKFIEATDTLKSWIGSYASLEEKQVWAPKYAPASEFGVQKISGYRDINESREGSERRELIKKVPKKVKAKRKSVRRK